MAEKSPASLSPLDSERFGVVAARADNVVAEGVPRLLSFCERNGVELVIIRCDGQDLAAARALRAVGMTEVEVQISYEGSLKPGRLDPSIREGVAADEKDVASLAAVGFKDMPSHYHADPRLSLEACRDLYVDWSLRGLSGEAADLFYVVENEGRTVGFMLYGCEPDRVMALLATVAPTARGLGLYSTLIRAGMAWGAERGAQRIIGITPHGNIAAQRNLIGLGLAPVSSTVTFHGWRDRFQISGQASSH